MVCVVEGGDSGACILRSVFDGEFAILIFFARAGADGVGAAGGDAEAEVAALQLQRGRDGLAVQSNDGAFQRAGDGEQGRFDCQRGAVCHGDGLLAGRLGVDADAGAEAVRGRVRACFVRRIEGEAGLLRGGLLPEVAPCSDGVVVFVGEGDLRGGGEGVGGDGRVRPVLIDRQAGVLALDKGQLTEHTVIGAVFPDGVHIDRRAVRDFDDRADGRETAGVVVGEEIAQEIERAGGLDVKVHGVAEEHAVMRADVVRRDE